MGGFVSKVTDAIGLTDYKGQQKAGRQAADQQLASTNAQIAAFERANAAAAERAKPFEQLATGAIPAFQQLLTPQGQMSYLQSNPMFQAAIDTSGDQLKAAGAASGKLGSGGMVDQLFKNYLATGETFIGNQFNRLLQPINIGQAASAGQTANALNTASNVAGVLGNQGNIQSAATINRSNLNQSALQGGLNMLSGGLMGSGILGGAGLAGGGMAGAGLGALLFSDARLKEDAERVGETDDGIPIYRWRYKGDSQVHIGPMAQDVEKVKPDAVLTHSSGYKMLNLEAL